MKQRRKKKKGYLPYQSAALEKPAYQIPFPTRSQHTFVQHKLGCCRHSPLTWLRADKVAHCAIVGKSCTEISHSSLGVRSSIHTGQHLCTAAPELSHGGGKLSPSLSSWSQNPSAQSTSVTRKPTWDPPPKLHHTRTFQHQEKKFYYAIPHFHTALRTFFRIYLLFELLHENEDSMLPMKASPNWR